MDTMMFLFVFLPLTICVLWGLTGTKRKFVDAITVTFIVVMVVGGIYLKFH